MRGSLHLVGSSCSIHVQIITMNTLIFAMLVACASAQYWPYSGFGYSTAALPAVWAGQKHQYHHQNELGQAAYGYSYPGQAAHNVRDAAGNQFGSYAYINPQGKHVQVSYTADHNGFRVLSNDLPVAPLGRKKRQVLSAVPYHALEHPNYPSDFVYSSTDLNRDGTPDNEQMVHVAPVATSYVAPFAAPYAALHHPTVSVIGRKKRQIFAPYGAIEHPQLAADFAYSSTDLNRDGQPDNKQLVYAAPAIAAAPYAYHAGFPYHYGFY